MGDPLPCWGCKKDLGHLWKPYRDLLKNNYLKEQALNALNIDRDCCRRMLLSSVNIVQKMLHFHIDMGKRVDILSDGKHDVSKPIAIKSEPETLIDITSIVNKELGIPDESCISIQGLDKVQVLKALWNNANLIGLPKQLFEQKGVLESFDEAKAKTAVSSKIDYFCTRPIQMDLSRDVIDATLYNKTSKQKASKIITMLIFVPSYVQ